MPPVYVLWYVLFVVLTMLFIIQFIYIQQLISEQRKNLPDLISKVENTMTSTLDEQRNDNRMRMYSIIVDVPTTLAMSVLISDRDKYDMFKQYWSTDLSLIVTCPTEVLSLKVQPRKVNMLCVQKTKSADYLVTDIIAGRITRMLIAGKAFMLMPMGLDHQSRYQRLIDDMYKQENVREDVRGALRDAATSKNYYAIPLVPVEPGFFNADDINTGTCKLPSESFLSSTDPVANLANTGTAYIAYLLGIRTTSIKTHAILAAGYKTNI
jgi:hypothetical protein